MEAGNRAKIDSSLAAPRYVPQNVQYGGWTKAQGRCLIDALADISQAPSLKVLQEHRA